MNILIIEDERALSHALELKLRHEGFSVTVAGNGQDGLALVDTRSFDVILLDLIMPAMDGFQVLKRLSRHATMPAVIVMSSLSQREDEARVLAMGARQFFIKSNTPLTDIVDAVKKSELKLADEARAIIKPKI